MNSLKESQVDCHVNGCLEGDMKNWGIEMSGIVDSLFIWGGNWEIEGDKAWFVPGESNILLQLDMKTGQREILTELPNNAANAYMLNCYCLKCGNDIFCMPYSGSDSIWVYQFENSQFRQIKAANTNPVQSALYISEFWRCGEKIFAVSRGLKQILEINIREKKIDNCYSACDGRAVEIAQSIKVGQAVYTVSSSANELYEFDTVTKKTLTYTIPGIEERLYAIGFDGKHFWFSGFSKRIYVWNKERNTIVTIDKFPEQFGIYNFKNNKETLLDCKSVEYDTPVFINIVAAGQYIWFIPLQTNLILYVDKDTYECKFFEIEEENETKDSLLKQRITAKYSLQYVREQRYIGLHSIKNNYIFEIDTLERKAERKEYSFDERAIQKIAQIYAKYGNIFYEGRDVDTLLFGLRLQSKNSEKEKKGFCSVGADIHKAIIY